MTGAPGSPATPFAGLLDDAAVFPPGNLPLPAAVAAHHEHRRSGYAELVGPLVLPATALAGLAPLASDTPVEVSVTLPGGRAAVAAAVAAAEAASGIRLAAVEVTLPAGLGVAELLAALDAALPGGTPAYVEVPRDEQHDAVLDALAGSRYRAKFRTGGLTPAACPSEAELARSIAGAVSRGVAFKCTAGLHHAIRHTDGDLEQHGFLNVLLAAGAALRRAGLAELTALLADRSAEAVAARVTGLSAAGLAGARAAFLSFGTCSVADPVRDLVDLGLVPASAAAR